MSDGVTAGGAIGVDVGAGGAIGVDVEDVSEGKGWVILSIGKGD